MIFNNGPLLFRVWICSVQSWLCNQIVHGPTLYTDSSIICWWGTRFPPTCSVTLHPIPVPTLSFLSSSTLWINSSGRRRHSWKRLASTPRTPCELFAWEGGSCYRPGPHPPHALQAAVPLLRQPHEPEHKAYIEWVVVRCSKGENNSRLNQYSVLTALAFPSISPSLPPSLLPSFPPSFLPSFLPSSLPPTLPPYFFHLTPSLRPSSTSLSFIPPSRPPSLCPSSTSLFFFPSQGLCFSWRANDYNSN